MLNYDEALNYILDRQSLGIKPGLSRIKTALESVGNPQDDINIIHIAGTNGKGTVANTIARGLQDNGLRVGLFTSPWVTDYRRQIQINGRCITKDDFAQYVSELFFDRNIGADLTEFESLTVLMYYTFAAKKVDYAVVECGMGGLNDATNVEKHNICSVLTSVSLDHTDFLGNTVEEILREKEGIIRDDSPCFRYRDTGDFNADNLDLANRVLDYLGYAPTELCKPIACQQRVGNVLVDGGHNADAGKALATVISDEIAVIGMMRDKDIDGYLSFVAPKCKKIICTTVDNKRAISAAELYSYAKMYCDNLSVIESPKEAVCQPGVTLVCGSFYLIREIIDSLP
ncbi:MAG: Mur ligase family protein [Eubacteriales bacterium]|nr:Mur ligase family protein [Eubacteriales bacterium]